METSNIIIGKGWQALKLNDTYILNIDFGSKVIESIEDLVRRENILSAEVSGVGATNNVTLGFYNFKNKNYDTTLFTEQMEITSAKGNIAYKDDELYVHLHLILGKEDYSTIAGHLVEAEIHGVGEFYIRTNPEKIYKSKKEDKDMWVYDFDK